MGVPAQRHHFAEERQTSQPAPSSNEDVRFYSPFAPPATRFLSGVREAEALLRSKQYRECYAVCTSTLYSIGSERQSALEYRQLMGLAHELLWMRGLAHLGRRDYVTAAEDVGMALLLAPTDRKKAVVSTCLAYVRSQQDGVPNARRLKVSSSDTGKSSWEGASEDSKAKTQALLLKVLLQQQQTTMPPPTAEQMLPPADNVLAAWRTQSQPALPAQQQHVARTQWRTKSQPLQHLQPQASFPQQPGQQSQLLAPTEQSQLQLLEQQIQRLIVQGLQSEQQPPTQGPSSQPGQQQLHLSPVRATSAPAAPAASRKRSAADALISFPSQPQVDARVQHLLQQAPFTCSLSLQEGRSPPPSGPAPVPNAVSPKPPTYPRPSCKNALARVPSPAQQAQAPCTEPQQVPLPILAQGPLDALAAAAVASQAVEEMHATVQAPSSQEQLLSSSVGLACPTADSALPPKKRLGRSGDCLSQSPTATPTGSPTGSKANDQGQGKDQEVASTMDNATSA